MTPERARIWPWVLLFVVGWLAVVLVVRDHRPPRLPEAPPASPVTLAPYSNTVR